MTTLSKFASIGSVLGSALIASFSFSCTYSLVLFITLLNSFDICIFFSLLTHCIFADFKQIYGQ